MIIVARQFGRRLNRLERMYPFVFSLFHYFRAVEHSAVVGELMGLIAFNHGATMGASRSDPLSRLHTHLCISGSSIPL